LSAGVLDGPEKNNKNKSENLLWNLDLKISFIFNSKPGLNYKFLP